MRTLNTCRTGHYRHRISASVTLRPPRCRGRGCNVLWCGDTSQIPHCENLSGETFWLKGSPYKMQKLCPRHKSRTPVFAIWVVPRSTGCRRHAGARQFLNRSPNNCFMTSQQFYFWSPPPRTVSQQYLVEIFCIRNIIFMLQRTGEKLEPCETLQFFVYEVNRCKIKSCC